MTETNIFISYSRSDSAFVIKLEEDLAKVGIDIWLDQKKIAAGKLWDREIDKALKSSGILILAISPNSAQSDNVANEVLYAINRGKIVIPVLIEQTDDIPFNWERFQRINLTKDYETGLNNLAQSLRHELSLIQKSGKEKEEQGLKEESEAKAKAEEEKRVKAEAEAKKIKEAEAEAKQKAEEERRVKAEAKRIKEAEAKAEEEQRIKDEAKTKQKFEEEKRLKAEAEAKQKAEEERRIKAEAEARRIEEEKAKAKAEEEKRIKAEAEAKRKSEEELRLKAEAEAKQKTEEEKRIKEQAEKVKNEKELAASSIKSIETSILKNPRYKIPIIVASVIAVLVIVIWIVNSGNNNESYSTEPGKTIDNLVENKPIDSTLANTNEVSEIKIGTQIWMAKNLDVITYRNGDPIPEVKDPAAWEKLTTGAWCYYNNDPANGAIYGKLYNWYAVNDPRGLAPQGWHIPTDEEWTTLTNSLGGEDIAGGKLKEPGTTHWLSPNAGATNESGFSGLPGGYRSYNGTFGYIGYTGDWWSSTEGSASSAWRRNLDYDGSYIHRGGNNKEYGFSVRCVRD